MIYLGQRCKLVATAEESKRSHPLIDLARFCATEARRRLGMIGRVVFERMTRTTDIHLKAWLGERSLKSKQMQDKIPFLTTGAKKSYKKAPDGAFTLVYPAAEYPHNQVQPVGFFLEVDRGTESNAVWAEKVIAYEQFRQSGLAQRYYGVKNFRVLTTVTTQRRLKNLVETTSQVGEGGFYWFTLQQNVDIFRPHLILGDIWTVTDWEGEYSLKSLRIEPNHKELTGSGD